MKKSIPKLVLERETLRALNNVSLGRVGGGLVSSGSQLLTGCSDEPPQLAVIKKG